MIVFYLELQQSFSSFSREMMASKIDSKRLVKKQGTMKRLNEDIRTDKITIQEMFNSGNFRRILSAAPDENTEYGSRMTATLKAKNENERNQKLYFNLHYNEAERQADLIDFCKEDKNYMKCNEIFKNKKKHDCPVFEFFFIEAHENSCDFDKLTAVTCAGVGGEKSDAVKTQGSVPSATATFKSSLTPM